MGIYINLDDKTRNIIGVYAGINGEVKKVNSIFSNKGGIATKLFGQDSDTPVRVSGFIGVGVSGVSWYSSDGIRWNVITGLDTANTYTSVAYGNGVYVSGGGYTDKIYYSHDGITWNESSLGQKYVLESIVYGEGLFVAVGETFCSYSADGINWATTSPFTISVSSVAYGDGRYVAVSNTRAWYSLNGITWNAMSGLSSNAHTYSKVAYGNGKFVLVGQKPGVSYHCTDGVNWVSGTVSLNTQYTIKYLNDRFISTAGYNASYYSLDGITWAAMPGTNASIGAYALSYANGKYICIDVNGNYYESENGTSWIKKATYDLVGIQDLIWVI